VEALKGWQVRQHQTAKLLKPYKRNPAMEKYISNTPPSGNTPRYIVETPNQLWGAYSWDNTYPVTLQDGSSRYAKLHIFTDLAIAKEVLGFLSRERGGAKLKIWQLADDGKRVEVKS
jgi:hypothetical protein